MTLHTVTVLLVDDQPMIGEVVRRMIAPEADIRFHYCADPHLAVERAVELSPTVILQDLVMPGLDGLTLVRAYRAEPRTREVPLIVLSTKDEPNVKVEAFGSGANDYLVKLPDRLELVARVRYHSAGYIHRLERNEAFERLAVSNAFIRDAFGRYVSDAVVRSLLESPAGLELGGALREVTILMCDLRGFTSLTERLAPAEVVRILNIFLSVMTDVLLEHGGTINEFIGDSVLAIFGAPVAMKEHAARAVRCAIAMQRAMAEVNRRNAEVGLPEVQMGVGLHTGEVIAGNIGSTRRAKYGIVGATVNMTARVESYTVGGQVLISAATLEAAGPSVGVSDRLEIAAKGLSQPIVAYDVTRFGDLALPPPGAPVAPLSQAVRVAYNVLSGKVSIGPAHRAEILALSPTEADLRADEELPALTDLRVRLDPDPDGRDAPDDAPADDFYVKVVARRPQEGTLAVRFTSLPAPVAAWLARHRSSSG